MAVGKNLTWKKEKEKQYHIPIILRLLGRISSEGEGRTEILEKNIKILYKKRGGKNIKLQGTLYTPEFTYEEGFRIQVLWTDFPMEPSHSRGLAGHSTKSINQYHSWFYSKPPPF